MRTWTLLIHMACFSLVAAACTDNKQTIQRRQAGTDKDTNSGEGDVTTGPKTGNANLNLSFADTKFKEVGLTLAGLTYKFLYHGAANEGAIAFQNGKSTLNFQSLPSNKAGDIRLEVYLDQAFVFVGVLPKVVLKNGENDLELTDFATDNVELNVGWDGKSFQGNVVWKLEGL